MKTRERKRKKERQGGRKEEGSDCVWLVGWLIGWSSD